MCELIRICLESAFDGFKRFNDGAVEHLRRGQRQKIMGDAYASSYLEFARNCLANLCDTVACLP